MKLRIAFAELVKNMAQCNKKNKYMTACAVREHYSVAERCSSNGKSCSALFLLNHILYLIITLSHHTFYSFTITFNVPSKKLVTAGFFFFFYLQYTSYKRSPHSPASFIFFLSQTFLFQKTCELAK